MVLPASGTLSLSDIKTEFGATGTRGLREFLRGGSFVPDTTANAGVPASGTITLRDLLSANHANIPDQTVTEGTSGDTRTITFRMKSDGNYASESTSDGVEAVLGSWIDTAIEAVTNYTVSCAVVSGTLASGSDATGSDLALTSNREWKMDQAKSPAPVVELVLDLTVKRSGTAVFTSRITISGA